MKLIKLLSLIIVTLIITNITLTNRAVDQSTLVSALTVQIQTLENDVTRSRAEIADLGSLTRLQDLILAAGFSETPTLVTLPTAASVALR
ncbi:MAG: hypothetical protein UX59_C0033G0002 [Microgenomates group bacterium GW2011_GWA1_46_7]|uniref:Uncharacterized protein n=1 Tax=Candidatus Collierbacteria bacterium RIFOXYA2_FULL_46_10 TaxID=1817726 RepID=A0A1F5F516_9BACT|nr:MAG: hypothetical protein UX59_C0033G0002 [Microgenomates group bacterium GW2011_GWA1_46_7]OGD74676.1 MAG: hypothetical protein A2228_01795 [Candidatus Collierbacteria bacterium RIFOXYA2_FULL_46_10]HBD02230.1 hypothetical protein [Candidatus Collierbacteria bacterium]